MPYEHDHDSLPHYKRVDFAARLLDFPEEMRDGIEERAAIKEYDGGSSRYSAELAALILAQVELERRQDAGRRRAWQGLSSAPSGA